MERLSKAKADRLFLSNAILIGSKDVLPLDVAIDFFGVEIVEYILHRYVSPPLWNRYDIPGTEGIYYLTYDGFLFAVTYSNIRRVQEERCRGGDVIDLEAYRRGGEVTRHIL